MTLVLDPAKFSDRAVDSIVNSTARLNIWDGSVRSTKTTCANLRWLDYAAREAPQGDLYMVGKTRDTLKRNVLRPLEDIVGKRALRYSLQSGEGRLFDRPLVLIGASNEAAETRLRGGTAAGAYGDEVTTWPESAFKMLLSRLSPTGSKFFGTTNPDSPNHWLKKGYLDREGELDLARFHFTLADNPFLDPAYVAALSLEYGGPGTLWHMRFIDGLWVLAEGAIYSMWDAGAHVVDWLPFKGDIKRSWIAVDYGTANPFVALLMHEVSGDPFDFIFVSHEYRWDSRSTLRQKTDAEYSSDLRGWLEDAWSDFDGELGVYRIVVDPSAASFIRQLYFDGWQGVVPGDNAVTDGIRGVSSLLTARRLVFHEGCDGTIDEMPGYSWDPKAQDRGEDKPLKRDDHGPDTARYGVWTLKRIWKHWVSTRPEQPVPLGLGA